MRAIARRLASIIAVAGLLAACGQGSSQVGDNEMVMGEADAPVTVIEYASITCPHCANWNATVYPEFKAKYVDTGQVRYVFREFLTGPVPIAAAGFLIARCAGEERYFGVIDALFHSQAEMFQGDPRGVLFRIGRSAGMNDEQITACIADEEAALQDRMDSAVAAGINATPSFLIGDTKLEGSQSLAQLDAAIQPLLAE
jgi:protein-disulfide isomerase